MVTRDIQSNVAVRQALESQVVTADQDGDGIDTQGFDSVMFTVPVGASGDTLSGSVFIELEVEESDDDAVYSDVADSDLSSFVAGTNDGTFALIDDPAEDAQVYSVGYKGNSRYVRLVVNVTGTHTNGTPIGAVAILGDAHFRPAS